MQESAKKTLVDASLALNIPVQGTQGTSGSRDVLCQGWLLKKRRKKLQGLFLLLSLMSSASNQTRLQGYARRYFLLYSTGIFCYSFQPNSDIRDQIYVPSAAISSTARRKDIHVDSERVTFHIKCLTESDFNDWMAALRCVANYAYLCPSADGLSAQSLRKFTASGLDAQRTFGRKSISKNAGQAGAIQHATVLLDEMGNVSVLLSQNTIFAHMVFCQDH